MKKVGMRLLKFGTDKATETATDVTKSVFNAFLWKIAIVAVLALTVLLSTCVGVGYLAGS